MKVTRSHSFLAVGFALLFHASARKVEYGQPCETPFDEEGKCVRIPYCQRFAHLVDNPISDENYSVLKQSWCGNWRDYPLICCPLETTDAPTTTSSTVRYGGSCRTPERRRGTCIRVKSCSRFAHLIGREDIAQSTLAILNESYCGSVNNVPLICCPSQSTSTTSTSPPTTTSPAPTTVAYKETCWTPNAVKGKCIKVQDCPQFSDALRAQPVSESFQEALNESFCGVRRNHKLVCCPVDDAPMPTSSPEPVTGTIDFGHSCRTLSGTTGTCIYDTDCQQITGKTMLKLRELTSQKESSCGMKNGRRLFCCPTASDTPISGFRCHTPSGEDGECIVLDQCSVLSSLVDSKSLSSSTLELLQKSHCGSQEKDNMFCCPSAKSEDGNDLKKHRNLYLLDQNICGNTPFSKILYDNNKIGKKAELSTFPWMALINYNFRSTTGFRCVGSIINRRYILTAARCVIDLNSDVKPISVRLGEYNLEYAIDCTDDACAPNPQNINIEEITAHPEFLGKSRHLNDIALIRLAKDINFGTVAVQPVCLPIEESLQTKDFTNKTLIVSGWFTSTDELSNVLLQDVLRGVSQGECSAAYINETSISPEMHLCVLNGRDDDCLGKGASPLVSFEEFLDRNAAVQHGIGLFGPDTCYRTRKPAVYTRVGNYMKWILDHLKP